MQAGNQTRIFVSEVATRDGFQMESRFIPTEDKIALVDRLGLLGYAKIEVTSFTSPKAIPALSDSEAVMQRIRRVPGVVYTALVPNRRGAERALQCRIEEFNVVMSVSETHNLANLRMTREQSFRQLTDVIELAQEMRVPVNVSLSCSFGCPMEGEIAPMAVMNLIDRFAARGVQGITLCDTTGMAYPIQVQSLCAEALARQPGLEFTAHFHNTRAMGLVNTIAAIESGIRRFDMSLGGIGGCPYAPGATGNVATEDVIHMLQCMGYDTRMNLDGLVTAAGILEALVQHQIPGQLSRSGPRLHRHRRPDDFEQIVAHAQARDMETAA